MPLFSLVGRKGSAFLLHPTTSGGCHFNNFHGSQIMKYNCVRIIPDPENHSWRIENSIDKLERVETLTIPNAGGFYHYPETMEFSEARAALVDCMVKRHKSEISTLKKSLNKLLDIV